MVNIRRATIEDAYSLCDRLRQQDLDEVKASHGLGGADAILLSFQYSTITYAAELKGRVICMFGVTQTANCGYPWLLGSAEVERIPVTFLRASRHYVDHFLKLCAGLENYVDARNTLSIQWLKWLGFMIEDPQPFGVEQRLFHRFHRKE